MASDYTVVTNPTVHVFVTSSVSTFQSERRFQKDLTIAALKGKLELVCGAASGSMMLDVFNKDNELVCKLDNDEALLGSYPIDDEMRIHVIDKSGKIGEFEDVSKVEKFEISEDEYKKRTDSVRAYKQRMKMGQFREISEEEQRQIEEEKRKKAEAEVEKLNSIHINDRCEVRLANQPPRRGTVKYVGNTDFKPGNWVGVQYDEPMGKNDGSVQGKRYFECPPKYGGFVKPGDLETGDFPELDIDDEMDEM